MDLIDSARYMWYVEAGSPRYNPMAVLNHGTTQFPTGTGHPDTHRT